MSNDLDAANDFPKIEYRRSRPPLSCREMKNWEPLSLKSRVLLPSRGILAIEIAPRLWGRSFGSGIEEIAGTTGAVQQAIGRFAQRIPTLNDEARHHTMKRGVVIKAHLRQVDKVLHVPGRIVRVKNESGYRRTEWRSARGSFSEIAWSWRKCTRREIPSARG